MLHSGLDVHIDSLLTRYPVLADIRAQIEAAYLTMEACFQDGGKLLIAGNGGSAADAEHITGELMKGFKLSRRLDPAFAKKLIDVHAEMGDVLSRNLQGALPAIALDGHPALTTAFMNDCDPQLCFAQQVLGYGTPGDVLLAISTSGNSKNILYAAVVAKAAGMKVVGLTGARPCELMKLADVCVQVPQTETYLIQELHLPVYHSLCMMLEVRFWGSHTTFSQADFKE